MENILMLVREIDRILGTIVWLHILVHAFLQLSSKYSEISEKLY